LQNNSKCVYDHRPLSADDTVTGCHGQTKGTECMHTRYESICSTIHSTDSEYYTFCKTISAIRDAMTPTSVT
jgi:hypothetical protein